MTASAHDRLLETASRLFYSEGIHTVGIDRILAEAGAAKRSLYTNFGSKDALVEAYLQRRHDATTSRLTEAITAVDAARDKILAVFDRAASEFRSWIHTMFLNLATDIGVAEPDRLARQLHALYDGGIVAARTEHDPTIAADTRAAAVVLLDSHNHAETRTPPSP